MNNPVAKQAEKIFIKIKKCTKLSIYALKHKFHTSLKKETVQHCLHYV